MNGLLCQVGKDIRSRCALGPRRSVLVAVSGGLDSMVLLTLLHRLSARHRWRLCVAHLNHQLRGRQSDADERLVRRAAARWKLPVVTARVDVRRIATARGISIEMAAREARHQFLAGVARRRRIRTIALAHHADDQVELFFLRLLRGAGSDGLAGMRWSGPSPTDPALTLIRPLLGRTKEELTAFAREEAVAFRHDASNASLDVLRNRVRHELIPLLANRYQPAVRSVVLRTMDLLAAEAGMAGEAAASWAKAERSRISWGDLPLAVRRRVLRERLRKLGIEPEFDRVEQLLSAPGKSFTVQPGWAVRHDGSGGVERVEHVGTGPSRSGEAACALVLKNRTGRGALDGMRFDWLIEGAPSRAAPPFGKGQEWFDADRVGRDVVLRHWRAGDRFQPSGMTRPVKLQDLFVNHKIPRSRRRALVVATTGEGKIWWVEGLRIAEEFKLRAGTRRRLRWRWSRPPVPGSSPTIVQSGQDLTDKPPGVAGAAASVSARQPRRARVEC